MNNQMNTKNGVRNKQIIEEIKLNEYINNNI